MWYILLYTSLPFDLPLFSTFPLQRSINTTQKTFSTMTRSILLINGPNLNLLGKREAQLYGSTTLPDMVAIARAQAEDLGATLYDFQSNCEGKIIDRIHKAHGKVDAIVINPGAFAHTSVAIRDALLSTDLPFVELHVTNIYAREHFRHQSYLQDKATAVICGMGTFGYTAAIEFAAKHMDLKSST